MQNSIPTTPLQSEVQNEYKNALNDKERKKTYYHGLLGDGAGNVEGSKAGYMKVRLPEIQDMVIEVFNARTTAVDGLPVVVGYAPEQPTLLQVLTVDFTTSVTEGGNAGQISSANIPLHHHTHEWRGINGGNDVTLIHLRQFAPLRPYFISTWKMGVSRGVVPTVNGWYASEYQEIAFDNQYYTEAFSDISGWGHYVLVYLDREGTLALKWGESKPLGILSYRDIPYPVPFGGYALCGVRFYHGQTALQDSDTITDLIDLRFPQPNHYAYLVQMIDKLGEGLMGMLAEHIY